MGHLLCQVLVTLAGLWCGAALPLLVFLLTGVPLALVLGLALSGVVAILLFNEQHGLLVVRPWLRLFVGGAGCGILLHGIFAFVGGWKFGS